jgi:hypothetical protein
MSHQQRRQNAKSGRNRTWSKCFLFPPAFLLLCRDLHSCCVVLSAAAAAITINIADDTEHVVPDIMSWSSVVAPDPGAHCTMNQLLAAHVVPVLWQQQRNDVCSAVHVCTSAQAVAEHAEGKTGSSGFVQSPLLSADLDLQNA